MNSDRRSELLERWSGFLKQHLTLFDSFEAVTRHLLQESAKDKKVLKARAQVLRLPLLSDREFIELDDLMIAYTFLVDLYPEKMSIMNFILEQMPKVGFGDLADIGSGPGAIPIFLLKEGLAKSAFCTEASDKRVRLAQQFQKKVNASVEVKQGWLNALPLSDSSVDTLMAIHTIEFSNRWREGLKEFSRVLRSEGKLLATFCNHGLRSVVDLEEADEVLMASGIMAEFRDLRNGRIGIIGTKVI